jgi:hypothetical protein
MTQHNGHVLLPVRNNKVMTGWQGLDKEIIPWIAIAFFTPFSFFFDKL